MNAIIYNVSIAAGTASITAGCWIKYGMPVALITAGAIVLAFSVLGAWLASERG